MMRFDTVTELCVTADCDEPATRGVLCDMHEQIEQSSHLERIWEMEEDR